MSCILQIKVVQPRTLSVVFNIVILSCVPGTLCKHHTNCIVHLVNWVRFVHNVTSVIDIIHIFISLFLYVFRETCLNHNCSLTWLGVCFVVEGTTCYCALCESCDNVLGNRSVTLFLKIDIPWNNCVLIHWSSQYAFFLFLYLILLYALI